jgi:hypothetical protein
MWHDEHDSELREYAIGVDWLVTRDLKEAIFDPALFANQNSACRLRDAHTVAVLTARFGLAGGA